MVHHQYLKYCTKEQEQEFLLSLHLWEGTSKEVFNVLYAVSNHIDDHYEYLEIPKKDGTKRKLWMPDFTLKKIQYNILHHILDGMKISEFATAYHKGSDIVFNVKPHVGKSMILKLDLKNFFEHITFDIVKNKVFQEEYFPESVATLLTFLCCHKGALPQGAPTSPAISNIILKDFDEIVGNWCYGRSIKYTRYCDDMVFSSENINKKELIVFIEEQLKVLGLKLNYQKTRLLKNGNQKMITGIIANEYMQAPRKYRKKLRQEIYYCKKFGISNHLKNQKLEMDCHEYIESLKGRIRFVLHINPSDEEFLDYRKWIQTQ